MRALLVLVGLAALVLVVLMSLGMVSINQTKTASFPTIELKGGTAPQFKADVGKIDLTTTNRTVDVPTVGTTERTIAVPTIQVERASNAQAPAQ